MKKRWIFLIILVLLGGGFYFILSTGGSVEVAWSEQDYIQAAQKTGIKIENIEAINLEALATGNYIATGSKPAEVTLTNAEFTALVAKANDTKGPIKGAKLRFTGPDSGEVSFKLSDGFKSFLKNNGLMGSEPIYRGTLRVAAMMPMASGLTDQLVNYVITFVGNSPVYANGTLKKTSANSVDVQISTLKVGQISMPADVVSRTEYEVTRILNAVIAPEHGFSIEELHIESGKIYYKGTLPEEIKGTQL